MSVFAPEVTTCPHCGTAEARDVAQSVNAERSPALRQAVLDGDFQRPACGSCGERYEIAHPFIYIDLPRRQWFGVYGLDDEPAWESLEHQALEGWQLACGPGAPAIAREVGQGVRIRCVFGLTALREKLVCHDAGLDDGLLEVLKYRIALPADGPPLSETNHLRLMEVSEHRLVFLLGGDDERQEPGLCEIDRADYADTEANPTRWGALHGLLAGGSYIDVGRLSVHQPRE